MRQHRHGSAHFLGPYSEPLANCRALPPKPLPAVAQSWSSPVLALLPAGGVALLERAGFHSDGDIRGLLAAELVAIVPTLSESCACSILHFSMRSPVPEAALPVQSPAVLASHLQLPNSL